MRSPPPVLLFVGAVLLHCAVLATLGFATPGGATTDTNNYLELALHLWRDGTYGAQVSLEYPPLYPMLIAPTFAIADNALRFHAIYLLHGLVLAAASLTLLPLLREHLGPARAWTALALLQFAGGATMHGYVSQSEALYGPLLVAVTGLTWSAWEGRKPAHFLALGLLAGLCICTRRMGLVVPLALLLLLAHDGVQWLRRRGPSPLLPLLLLAVGLAFGLLPEAVARALHGAAIDPYSEGSAGSHLGAAKAALLSLDAARLSLALGLRHIAYLTVATFGAPLLLWAALLARQLPPLGLRRAQQAVVYIAGGSIALTTMHMARYWSRPDVTRGWDLYPRYVDPLEVPLLALALPSALWLTHRLARDRVLPYLALVLAALWGTGALARPRGGRILPARVLERWLTPLSPSLADLAPWVFAAMGTGILLLWALRWRRGGLTGLPGLALALAVSWGISLHSPILRLRGDPEPPAVLRATALTASPRAPLAVVIRAHGAGARAYYEPAFRSDHPVWWVRLDALPAWQVAHPEGYVLALKTDPPLHLPLRQRSSEWLIYRASEASP